MFDDATLMPNLKHLQLTVHDPVTFVGWSFEWEVTTKGDTYRRPEPTASTEATPLAPRLVCIETDPGPRSRSPSRSPTRSRIAEDAAVAASTSVQPSAAITSSSSSNLERAGNIGHSSIDFGPSKSISQQTLFKDGLHSMYAFLTLPELVSGVLTCHAWYSAAEQEPCRRVESRRVTTDLLKA
jgi:hypothetical protein